MKAIVVENCALAQEKVIGSDNTILISTIPLTELAGIIFADDKEKRKYAAVTEGPDCIDDIDDS